MKVRMVVEVTARYEWAVGHGGVPCGWCSSTAPSHYQHGCGKVHCPFTGAVMKSSASDDGECLKKEPFFRLGRLGNEQFHE